SAGGHLALWAAGRHRQPGPPPRVRLAAAVGQAPLADLALACDVPGAREAVVGLLGGTPDQHPERLAAASPRARRPPGVPQLVVHGRADDVVPRAIGRSYAAAASTAGDAVTLVELPGAGHFEHLDVASDAWAAVVAWLAAQLGPRSFR